MQQHWQLCSVQDFFPAADTQTQAADTRSMIAEQSAAAAADTDIRGDLNGDGLQDVADAQLLMQYYVANTLANKPQTWAQILSSAPGTDPAEADRENAEKAMKRFLDASVEGDAEKILKYSGMGDLMRLLTGSTKTDEELVNDPSFTVNQIEAYTIGEVQEDPEALAEYQDLYTKSLAEAKNTFANKKAEASELRMAYLVQTILKPVEKMYKCHVSITADGETRENDLNVACDDKGEWRVDLGANAALANYSERSKIAAANSAASSLYKGITSVLVDMDEEGIDVSVLNGDYTLTGAQVAAIDGVDYNVNNITKEQALDLLMVRLNHYFSAATTLEQMSFRIQDGSCIATAVEKKLSDKSFIGSYPQLPSEDTEGMTVSEAMQKAAQYYS